MPQTFKDNTGQQWTISLTLGVCRKIRTGRIPIDVFNPEDWGALMDSLEQRLTYIWFLVEDAARDLDVTAEQFEQRLYGDGIADGASLAFMQELSDFFHRLGQKTKISIGTEEILAMMKSGVTEEEIALFRQELKSRLMPGGG